MLVGPSSEEDRIHFTGESFAHGMELMKESIIIEKMEENGTFMRPNITT